MSSSSSGVDQSAHGKGGCSAATRVHIEGGEGWVTRIRHTDWSSHGGGQRPEFTQTGGWATRIQRSSHSIVVANASWSSSSVR